MPDDDTAPCFSAEDRLTAPRYGDLYFSKDDGLAETGHVFLLGNELPKRFAAIAPETAGGGTGPGRFTIGETGFGTGLNFLAAWRLFEARAPSEARLCFFSVEKHPLEAETIRRALTPWPELAAYRDGLLSAYAPSGAGLHRMALAGGRVELTLLVGEASVVMSEWGRPADAWFLDGFAPARNPAMWSAEVFEQLARLSRPGTTLATYTAAGFVRRGLAVAGFGVEKRPGFGTKRDMTAGRFRDE